jgi:hypothetical protein
MVLPWIVAAAALVVAFAAWAQTRRTAKRLEQLSQMYWEVKYQYMELRMRLEQTSGHASPPPRTPERPLATDAFVPLASLKR